MGEGAEAASQFGDLPFHEYCTHCQRQFDETILDPTVTIVETEDERVLHSFCNEECLTEWAGDRP